jgi:hypothetical protein
VIRLQMCAGVGFCAGSCGCGECLVGEGWCMGRYSLVQGSRPCVLTHASTHHASKYDIMSFAALVHKNSSLAHDSVARETPGAFTPHCITASELYVCLNFWTAVRENGSNLLPVPQTLIIVSQCASQGAQR